MEVKEQTAPECPNDEGEDQNYCLAAVAWHEHSEDLATVHRRRNESLTTPSSAAAEAGAVTHGAVRGSAWLDDVGSPTESKGSE